MSRRQNLCPQQMLQARANGETFVPATMCPRLPGPFVSTGTPFFISNLKCSYDKYSVDKVFTFISEELPRFCLSQKISSLDFLYNLHATSSGNDAHKFTHALNRSLAHARMHPRTHVRMFARTHSCPLTPVFLPH